MRCGNSCLWQLIRLYERCLGTRFITFRPEELWKTCKHASLHTTHFLLLFKVVLKICFLVHIIYLIMKWPNSPLRNVFVFQIRILRRKARTWRANERKANAKPSPLSLWPLTSYGVMCGFRTRWDETERSSCQWSAWPTPGWSSYESSSTTTSTTSWESTAIARASSRETNRERLVFHAFLGRRCRVEHTNKRATRCARDAVSGFRV